MKIETIIKANTLLERIKKLTTMKSDLRPQFCNGVGVCKYNKGKNDNTPYYIYNLWSTHNTNMGDDDIIMRVGINAMYEKVSQLLEEAEKELEKL